MAPAEGQVRGQVSTSSTSILRCSCDRFVIIARLTGSSPIAYQPERIRVVRIAHVDVVDK